MSEASERGKRIRVLVLSGGSLLGQNILDLLEPRRSQLYVIGADAEPENPRLFRYDCAYAVPALNDENAFSVKFDEILESEQPHIVLPGRDFDVLFLARRRERASTGPAIPCGALECAEIMQDKWASYQFAQRNGLAFADSLLLRPQTENAEINAWLGRHSFPVLAKPLAGFGSHGIRVILSAEQAHRVRDEGDYLLQEFLGPVPDLATARRVWEYGVPWFFSVPEEQQFAAQTVISPDGSWWAPFCGRSRMVMGRCEGAWKVQEPDLLRLANGFAKAFAADGWRGSLNMQFKRAADGTFRAHEFNGRMSGATSARRYMGFDEFRILAHAFLDRDIGPANDEPHEEGYVLRTLTDAFVPMTRVNILRNAGVWRKPI